MLSVSDGRFENSEIRMADEKCHNIMSDAKTKCNDIMADAKAKCSNVMADAEVRCRNIMADANARAMTEGRRLNPERLNSPTPSTPDGHRGRPQGSAQRRNLCIQAEVDSLY